MKDKIIAIILCMLLTAIFALTVSGNMNYLKIDKELDDFKIDPTISKISRSNIGTNWYIKNKLIASDGEASDEFGWSVSISGDYAIVGALNDELFTGSVYIYKYDGIDWIEEEKLTAPDGEIYDFFGHSVSIDGDYAIVGALQIDDKGAAYIFKRGSIWEYEATLTASDGEVGDYFGHSVSIDGDHAIVGARFADNDKGAAYIFKRSGSTWIEDVKLQASDGEVGDYFGHSVSISLDYAIVGADWNDNKKGSVYVFKNDDTTWSEEVNLQASDVESDDFFGGSISIKKDYIIIGATGDDDNGNSAGCAYIFKYSDNIWNEEAKLLASDGASSEYFGCSVSISGFYSIIGSYRDDENGQVSGSAYIFKCHGSTWIEDSKIYAFDGAISDKYGFSVSIDEKHAIAGANWNKNSNGYNAGAAYIYQHDNWRQNKLFALDGDYEDNFGVSVAIDEDYAIIGARDDNDNGNNSGSAYIFKREGTTWAQQVKLLAFDGEEDDNFGWAVAIDGDYAIVGSRYDDDDGYSSGSAYVYKREGTTWNFQAKLLPTVGYEGANFGWAVAIDGDYAIIGAPRYGYIDRGCAYIFKRDGTAWTQQAWIYPSDPANNDYFGYSVSIFEDYAIIGAYVDDDNGLNSGSAYIFKREDTSWSEQAKILAIDGEEHDHFGEKVSIYEDTVLIGALGDDDNGETSGSAYIFKRDGTTWTQQTKLNPLDAEAGDQFGSSVSICGDTAVVGAQFDDFIEYCSGSAYVFKYDGASWTQEKKLHAADMTYYALFGFTISTDGDSCIVGAIYDDENGDWSGSAYVNNKLTPDLDSDGSLSWTDVKPGDFVIGEFIIENIGTPYSLLNWEIESYPEWGSDWTFLYHNNYLPDGVLETVYVGFLAPSDPNTEFSGEIKLVNVDDTNDFEIIPIYLKTPRNKEIYSPIINFLKSHPNMVPIFRYVLKTVI